jgi:hypothetical protein
VIDDALLPRFPVAGEKEAYLSKFEPLASVSGDARVVAAKPVNPPSLPVTEHKPKNK